MSDTLDAAVVALNDKFAGENFDGSVKFVIEDEGSILIDEDGARRGDGDADCTLTASRETFEDIMNGALDPTAAFMSGRLSVDGDMGLAMKLGSLLG